MVSNTEDYRKVKIRWIKGNLYLLLVLIALLVVLYLRLAQVFGGLSDVWILKLLGMVAYILLIPVYVACVVFNIYGAMRFRRTFRGGVVSAEMHFFLSAIVACTYLALPVAFVYLFGL